MDYLIGMGNYAMGDDGIGLRIVEHIAENLEAPGFECIEVGNNGMQLLTYFEEQTGSILIVDAVKFGGKPGEYTLFSPDEVQTNKVVGNVSTHEGDILKLIAMARDLGLHIPRLRILAVEPGRMDPDTELSPALQANFEKYIKAVLHELGRD